MSSVGESIIIDDKSLRKEASQQTISTIAGPGGTRSPRCSRSTLQLLVLLPRGDLYHPSSACLSSFSRRSRKHGIFCSGNRPCSQCNKQWTDVMVPGSILLSGGVCVLVTGRLGDHFGHKYVFYLRVDLDGHLVSSQRFRTQCHPLRLCSRMTGVGNGALVPNSFALLARAFPPFSVKKNIAFAFLGFCAPSGYIFGGLIGAVFAEKVTWRWGFWFWAIGCLVLGITTFVVVPHTVGSPIPGLSLKQFDYILARSSAYAGSILFAFAWNQASVVGWQDPYTYTLL